MIIKGEFVFTVSDVSVDFNSIEKILTVEPIKIIKRGQLIGKLKNIEAPLDIYSIERKFFAKEDIFKQLLILLDDLLPYHEFIKELAKRYNSVAINCYIRSEYGQIGFEMSNEIIVKLGIIGIAINFNILSFGGVEE